MIEKYSCIVIDDEPLGIELITDFVNQIPFLQLRKTFGKPVEAMSFLQDNPIDLVFSDIEMPKLTGLDLLETLAQQPIFIFITAHRHFAIDGFEKGAADYLIKPVRFDRFLKAVNRVKEQLDTLKKLKNSPVKTDRIFIKSESKFIRLMLKDIVYIEAQGNYLTIVTLNGTNQTLSTLKAMEEILHNSSFFRIHRAFIVNTDYIQSLNGNIVQLSNGKIIPIASNKKDLLYSLLGLH